MFRVEKMSKIITTEEYLILNCSSENPSYPATNLLVDNSPGWISEGKNGSISSVTFTFRKSHNFTKIVIGNNGSCIISIQCSNGNFNKAVHNFEFLLDHRMIMYPEESRKKTNIDRVMTFNKDKFNEDTAKKKWNRIKITCHQPFNKDLSHGIKSVQFYSEVDVLKSISPAAAAKAANASLNNSTLVNGKVSTSTPPPNNNNRKILTPKSRGRGRGGTRASTRGRNPPTLTAEI